jgi:hypothetical protein
MQSNTIGENPYVLFLPGYSVVAFSGSSTNETNHHDIAKILLKVALNITFLTLI